MFKLYVMRVMDTIENKIFDYYDFSFRIYNCFYYKDNIKNGKDRYSLIYGNELNFSLKNFKKCLTKTIEYVKI